MNYYGIDLGTINCSATKVYEQDGKINIEILKDNHGNKSFRSMINFNASNFIKIGDYCDNIDSESIVELIKIRLGEKKHVSVKVENEIKNLTPQLLNALLLNHYKKAYDNDLKKAVITVPANFNQNKRSAIIESAEIVNIDVVELIEEPSAAIMFHIMQKYKENQKEIFKFKKPQRLMVFDFGGGTLDISLVEVYLDEDNNIVPTVKVIGGDSKLGGNLIDFELAKLVLTNLEDVKKSHFIAEVAHEFNYYFDNYKYNNELIFRNNVRREVKDFIYKLIRKCENAKISLSYNDEIEVKIEELNKTINISREDFNQLVMLNSGIEEFIIEALKEFDRKNKDIVDEVVLIGGTSQIPYVKELLFNRYSKLSDKITTSNDYIYAVSNGAAIICAIKNGLTIEPFGVNTCTGIISKSIYINYYGHERKFISFGETYPFDNEKSYDFKIRFALTPKIKIQIIEKGIERGIEVANIINNISFYHPCLYTGDDIRILLNVDNKGLFKFKAIHLQTSEEIEFDSEKEFELSEQEIVKNRNFINKLNEI